MADPRRAVVFRPFAKVTKETLMTQYKCHKIRKKQKARRAAEKEPPEQIGALAKATKSTKKPRQPKVPASPPPPPPPKRCEGLRGVKYMYDHYAPPKKIVHHNRESGLKLSSTAPSKVGHILPLPGQEYVPLLESNDDLPQGASEEEEGKAPASNGKNSKESQDEASNEDEGSNNGVASDEGVQGKDVEEPSGSEDGECVNEDKQRSKAGTILKSPSDAKDFPVEYGEPKDSRIAVIDEVLPVNWQANRLASIGHHAGHSKVLLWQKAILYACSPPHQGVPAPIPPGNLPLSAGAGTLSFADQEPGHIHGVDVFKPKEQPKEHPFGRPQNIPLTLNPLNFTPGDMALLGLTCPENFSPTHTLQHDPLYGTSYNPPFVFPDNTLGLGVDQVLFGSTGALNPHETTSYGVPNTPFSTQAFETYTGSFLDMMRNKSIPELQPQPPVVGTNPSTGTLPGANHCPLAPPISQDPTVPTGLLLLSSLATLHARTPFLYLKVLTCQQTPLSSSCLFARSISAPLQIPLKRALWQPDSPFQATTCPSTPAKLAWGGSTPWLPALPGSPFPNANPSPLMYSMPMQPIMDEMVAPIDMQGTVNNFDVPLSSNNTNVVYTPNVTSDELPIAESDDPPHLKRRHVSPTNRISPTDEELNANAHVEVSRVKAKRKTKPCKKNETENKNDNNDKDKVKKAHAMGNYPCDQQVYMHVGRSNMSWDQVARSPWSEAKEAMVKCALEHADQVTGMWGGEFADEVFIATMMGAVSQLCSGFLLHARDIVNKLLELKVLTASKYVVRDQFLYRGNPTNPANFFKSPAAVDMTVALFFNKTINIGGIYIRDLLCEDSSNVRCCLFTLTAAPSHGSLPSSFDYADMSADALYRPLIAAMAFAGITLLHGFKKSSGSKKWFNEANYGDDWGRYVRNLIAHPQLGLICATIFEKIKHKYCEVYEQHRLPTSTGPRTWEWQDKLCF